MLEIDEFLNLQKQYKFLYTHFSAPISVTRVIAFLDFTATAMDGARLSCDKFYFEVHKSPFGRPITHFPSDATIPPVLLDLLGTAFLVFPAPIRRMLGVDLFVRTMSFHTPSDSHTPIADQVKAVLLAAGVKGIALAEPQESTQRTQQILEATSNSLRKKFVIKNIDAEVVEKRVSTVGTGKLSLLSSKASGQNVDRIVFLKTALQEILSHIEYGNKTSKNIVEQGGVYVGSPFVLPSGERIGLAKCAIPASNTKGSSTYVEFSHDIWRSILSTVDERKAEGTLASDDVILGWYHTHPNGLDVFMSGTDLSTQREQFYRAWNSAVVINPHRKLIAGFYGKEATQAEVYLLQS